MHFSWSKTPFPGHSECFVAVLLTSCQKSCRILDVFTFFALPNFREPAIQKLYPFYHPCSFNVFYACFLMFFIKVKKTCFFYIFYSKINVFIIYVFYHWRTVRKFAIVCSKIFNNHVIANFPHFPIFGEDVDKSVVA